jgi:hypothetical protein
MPFMGIERFRDQNADLAGHPDRDPRLCLWSSPIEGSTKRRFVAVLHQPPVDSPQAAVRAGIVAESRNR